MILSLSRNSIFLIFQGEQAATLSRKSFQSFRAALLFLPSDDLTRTIGDRTLETAPGHGLCWKRMGRWGLKGNAVPSMRFPGKRVSLDTNPTQR